MRDIKNQKRLQASWYQRVAKQRRLDWLKTNGPCRRCSSWNDLEVDHINPATKISNRIWSWTKSKREEELAKCQPLCKACHLLKTNAEKSRPITHGTESGYRDKGCRCELCRKVHAARVKRWKDRVKYGTTVPERNEWRRSQDSKA